MRLLNTKSFKFKEFYELDYRAPPYAILSHRWDREEVSFQDFNDREVRRNPRFNKIKQCCRFARKHDFEWVWIDTCCIDKTNSTELTEAINSMYHWCGHAAVCLVYLWDVILEDSDNKDRGFVSDFEFCKSEWFTRGWTLQELLAPDEVVFLDCGWEIIGSRNISTDRKMTVLSNRDLGPEISSATSISLNDLSKTSYSERGGTACMAQKLSWLSKRETSRIEDMAYCMLGLCGVNMPLFYGEGEQAFVRLQSEIIKVSDDESIFAWRHPQRISWGCGILAQSPRYFQDSSHVIRRRPMKGKKPFMIINKGLQYQIPHPKDPKISQSKRWYTLQLDCSWNEEDFLRDPAKLISIHLKWDEQENAWIRTNSWQCRRQEETKWTNVVEQGCTFETINISTRDKIYRTRYRSKSSISEDLRKTSPARQSESDTSTDEDMKLPE